MRERAPEYTDAQRLPAALAEISQPVRPDWGGVAAGVIFLAPAALAFYAARDLPSMHGFAFGPAPESGIEACTVPVIEGSPAPGRSWTQTGH
jgi:hypothetical protein